MSATLRLVTAALGVALAPTRETRRRADAALLWAQMDTARHTSGQYDLPILEGGR